MRTLVSLRLAVITLALLALGQNAEAQYFGRNKVQYENFNFKILHTEHFDIHYYDAEKDSVADVGRMAERWYGRLSRVFGHSFTKKPIVLYANSADFHQTTTTGGLIGEGTGGFTDAFQNRVVLPLTGDNAENDHVLGHELVHVFQYDIATRASSQGNQRRFNLEQLPLWLIEGMAEYFSKGRIDPLTAMWMRDATNHDRLPDFRKLTRDPRYFPYRYGQALLAYIGGRYGDDNVVRLFLAAGVVGPEEAFLRVLGAPVKDVFNDWHASARDLYEPVLIGRPESLGKPLLAKTSTRGGLNISPSLSPDGRWIAFLTTRELFSIDLYLADATTGKLAGRLVSAESDPHFEALRFIDSAGGWSPDSKKLVVVVFEQGDNRLAIIDVGSRRVDERIRVPGINSMTNPVWSPDGQTIAFSGSTGAVTDLFLYDLRSKTVRRLTDDPFSDLQPAWSPDGRSLAFVTDRGKTTDLERLFFGPLQIATIDVSSGSIRTISLFPSARHINPQYAPDGKSVYFIANPEGIADVYRANLDGTNLRMVTHVPTGVSGITDSSPAMSIAARTGQMAVSLFENNDYNVYQITSPPAGEAVTAEVPPGTPRAALLPPARPSAASFTSYLRRPDESLLPDSGQFTRTNYDNSLHLSYLGPPTLGVGASRNGYGVGGSVSAYFTDVLGQQNVGVTFQGGGGSTTNFTDSFGAELFYLNQTHRINWGASGTHIPYVTASTGSFQEIIEVNGQKVLADVIQQRRDVVTLDELSGLTQYPLSLTRRFEANAGVQRLSFKSEIQQQIIVGNQVIDDNTTRLGENTTLNFARGALAYVGDSSYFGFISPIKGTRYRFEAEGLSGDLNFETALADYRKYFFARPVTLAVRGLHYGRYGRDAEDNRLSSLYLGQSSLVRGYDVDSFNLSECVSPANSTACPAFDRLIGSKIALASTEIRVPLFGTKEFGLISGAFLPTELFGFADAGAAWTEAESPKLKFKTDTLERVPVFSAGVGLRILLSYIPLEVYYAHPFQRPGQDWVFGFNISPGW